LEEFRLPFSFLPASLGNRDYRLDLARSIEQEVSGLDPDLGDTVASLGGGLYQIQRVPLELAGDEDRRDQINWEVSQALISPAADYSIEFHTAGRAAFWVAVRHEVLDVCAEVYASAGIPVKGLVVEPVALSGASEMVRARGGERIAAIHYADGWLSFVSEEAGRLASADAVCVGCPSHSGSQYDSAEGDEAGAHRHVDAVDVARRWIEGDLAQDRRRAAYQRVVLCGEPDPVHHLIRRLRSPYYPELVALRPFSACDVRHLPESHRPLLSRQCAFGVAAGLAYLRLKGDIP
jgi:hypothetical protein